MAVKSDTLTGTRARKRFKVKMIHLRRVVQVGFVAFAFFIGLRHLVVGGGSSGAPSLDAFCPFGAVESLWSWITTGTFLRSTNTANLVILVAVLATALLMGRAFCGWMCPLGAVQEWIARLGSKLTGGDSRKRRKGMIPVQLPRAIDKPLRFLKYLVLASILWSSLEAVFPPLREFCPYRILFGLHLETPLAIAVLVAFLAASLLVERFWCKYLCPLGALLSVTNKIAPIKVATDKKICTACGRCGASCPMGIEERAQNITSPECIRCLDCVDTCARPDALSLRLGYRTDD
jgi:polyferredoxin